MQCGVPETYADSQSKRKVEVVEGFKSPEEPTMEMSTSDSGEDQGATQEKQPVPLRWSERHVEPPDRYGWEPQDYVAFVLLTEIEDPSSYKEVIETDDSDRWITTMKSEMKSLDRNQIWDLIDLPKGSKEIGCKWVFRKKDQEHYNARLVAKEYAQKEVVDYHEIFSPVVKYMSIRLLLVMVSRFDFELEEMGVKTAFLHGELEEKIYMKQSEGYICEGNEQKVCLLKRSLYGLK